eukprot:TRINITY_DN5010_c1_g1_i2.p1 TRINITY_DN5010_c1_g1~~TRINITY_DN5010_c1_g1_i2.p1  ORF type:complete len:118 (+),score=3.00 TRINITY_DN5010_c1_g1_i2:181-534(+)
MCQTLTNQDPGPVQQRTSEDHNVVAHPDRVQNPLPSSGSRRDSCGCPSVGSEGHEDGRCAGPCKDLRSGRGCTFGKKCKLCHLPHPEVSSTKIRKQRMEAKRLAAEIKEPGKSCLER